MSIHIVNQKPAPAADCARCKYCNFYEGGQAECDKWGMMERADIRADGCRDYSREDF